MKYIVAYHSRTVIYESKYKWPSEEFLNEWNELTNNENLIINVWPIKETKKKTTKDIDPEFTKLYEAYGKKGSPSKSLDCWNKLSDKDKAEITKLLPLYVKERNKTGVNYQTDFQRFISPTSEKNWKGSLYLLDNPENKPKEKVEYRLV